ncbi:DNA recombination protein RmuC [Salmonella sp. NCTC 11881]|nr:DNA recombination protein RmuC [Salmonella sp. NCTC 11881]
MRSTSQTEPVSSTIKMRLFVDDMSAIGQSLDKAQDNYRQAMKKLASGRGNVFGAGGGLPGARRGNQNARLIRI